MTLPSEIELVIISYIPSTRLTLVCKSWNKEIENYKKKSIDVISKWYKRRRVTRDNYHYNTLDLVRYYSLAYEDCYYFSFPEFAISKWGLDESMCQYLPLVENRKRSHIKEWMLSLDMPVQTWMYIGM